MWTLIELLYETAYYIYKSADALKWDALIVYIIYALGRRSGMKMVRKFLAEHSRYFADEEAEWKRWVSKQIVRLGGEAFIPARQYGNMRRFKRTEATNSNTSSRLSQGDTPPEGVLHMARLIAVDDGHGMQTAGKRTPAFADGSVMKENEFNRAVVDKLIVNLKRNGFDVLHVSPGDDDVPLKNRTGLANNTIPNGFGRPADVYVSVHANALGGHWNEKAQGIETFYHKGSTEGRRLAEAVHNQLIKGVLMVNRGLKTANLHVTRESKMPAILVECGFMDNPIEAKLLLTDAYRSECAEEIARGICDYFGQPYIETPKQQPIGKDGMTRVDIVVAQDIITGFLMGGRAYVPARPVLDLFGAKWYYDLNKKQIVIDGTPVETQIIDNVSYIKSVDLTNHGIARPLMDPDALNPKKVYIKPY